MGAGGECAGCRALGAGDESHLDDCGGHGGGPAHAPALWRWDGVLSTLGRLMGPALGAGKLNFTGRVPNGQSFQARPLRV